MAFSDGVSWGVLDMGALIVAIVTSRLLHYTFNTPFS